MSNSDPIGVSTDLGIDLASAHSRVPRPARPSPPGAVEQLRTLAFDARAAFVGGRLDEATETSSRFESLLWREHAESSSRRSRDHEERDVEAGDRAGRRPAPTGPSAVVAASVRDADGRSIAETVALLTVLYCRSRRIQAVLDAGPDRDRSARR